jgi:transposase
VGQHGFVVGCGELTDAAWARIEALLPAMRQCGGRWRDHRQVINAILWQARTGVPWRDLPEGYGPWKTAHERLRKWTADGTWERLLREVQVEDDAVGAVERTISVDSSHVPRPPARRRRPERGAAPSRLDRPGESGDSPGLAGADQPVSLMIADTSGRTLRTTSPARRNW